MEENGAVLLKPHHCGGLAKSDHFLCEVLQLSVFGKACQEDGCSLGIADQQHLFLSGGMDELQDCWKVEAGHIRQ